LKKALGTARRITSDLLSSVEQTQNDIRSGITPAANLALDPSILSGLDNLRSKLNAMEALGYHSNLCSDNHQFIYDLCSLCNKEMHVVNSLHRAMPQDASYKELITLLEATKRDIMAVARNVRILEERIADCQHDLLYKNGPYGVRPIFGDTSGSNRMTDKDREVF
jgi:hypothetical protein